MSIEETIEQRIEKAKREIERLKNLPPRTSPRRPFSGNARRDDYIARQERQIEILEGMKAKRDGVKVEPVDGDKQQGPYDWREAEG